MTPIVCYLVRMKPDYLVGRAVTVISAPFLRGGELVVDIAQPYWLPRPIFGTSWVVSVDCLLPISTPYRANALLMAQAKRT